jgi:hypothetical protein
MKKLVIVTQGSRVVLMKQKAFKKFKKFSKEDAAFVEEKYGLDALKPFNYARMRKNGVVFEARKEGRSPPHIALIGGPALK